MAERNATSGQRLSPMGESLGNHEQTQHTRGTHTLLNVLGALVIAGTYLFTVLSAGGGAEDMTVSLPLVSGYAVGAILLLLGNLQRIPLSAVALIPFAVAFNIVLGQIVGFSGIPLYLDSIATILVAYLAGPAAGVLTGVVTNLAWGLTINPTTIPFAAGAAVIGVLAGIAGQHRLLERWWTALLAGFGTGIVAGFLGAPVAAFVFGGGQGVGTGSLVAVLQATGQSLLGAATLQSLLSDPLDKAIAFLLVWAVAKTIPQRVKNQLTAR
ncbi:ECF transporter S component [Rothia sp. ND6WE1A]|uniref:ECF transporter S component n=1 Tax=Rothia sp. ND6WE1A TaxID=1848190 RepID=UPI0011469ACD|nr:ECF transporter S component [Rothia sp. ND6WE1A]